jgi:hypothetical protein
MSVLVMVAIAARRSGAHSRLRGETQHLTSRDGAPGNHRLPERGQCARAHAVIEGASFRREQAEGERPGA